MESHLDFEKPIVSLEKKLQDLRDLASQEGVDFGHEISILEKRVDSLIDETFARLSPWQRVQLSRHPQRPYAQDYIAALFPDFLELHGDRQQGDDPALVGGVATWKLQSRGSRLPEIPILILGHQKGRTTKQKMERNFGMARPEGYRKAVRLARLAERSRMPILCLIDTPGAYPGIEAEQRGQAQAIAESILAFFELQVPVLAAVIGEGGSGGALALGVADRVLISEYGTYSVISPESCASILWSDATLAAQASEKLKMGSAELLRLGVVDAVIPEPKGGSHRNWPEAFELAGRALVEHFDPLIASFLESLTEASPERRADAARKLVDDRQRKFRRMGESALHRVSQGAERETGETGKEVAQKSRKKPETKKSKAKKIRTESQKKDRSKEKKIAEKKEAEKKLKRSMQEDGIKK
jgi:acetyl-CoA carboxylase carboxyl transferase subunit alpha